MQNSMQIYAGCMRPSHFKGQHLPQCARFLTSLCPNCLCHTVGCRHKRLPCLAVRAGRPSAAMPLLLLMPSTLVERQQQLPTQQPSLQLTQVCMHHRVASSNFVMYQYMGQHMHRRLCNSLADYVCQLNGGCARRGHIITLYQWRCCMH
jgi:hypothetical protein